MTRVVFETFSVFVKEGDCVTCMYGIRTTRKKFAIFANYKFLKKETIEHKLIQSVNQEALAHAYERFFEEYDSLEWFNSKEEAVEAYLRRFAGFL